MTSFGEFLRGARRAAGLSQSKLADALGVTSTYIHLLEKGRVDAPTDPRCEQLAEALSLDVGEVLRRARSERLERYKRRQGWDGSDGAEPPAEADEVELTEQEHALLELVRTLDPETRRDFDSMVYMLLRHRPEGAIQRYLEVYAGSARRAGLG